LTQGKECFEATLAANEIVWFAVTGIRTTSDSNGPLQTDVGDIGDDSLKDNLIAASRVQHVDLIDRDHLNNRSCVIHAASGIRAL
jgi:hypothetical protein